MDLSWFSLGIFWAMFAMNEKKIAKIYTDVFRRDAVRKATTSEFARTPTIIGFGCWAFDAKQMGSKKLA